ncbi:MAG: nicotinate-nucleotide--dimethylbenzimidazole phosphoribosyltransferase [Oscillospiraceae bacterium]|nr:nicotinate-nucleotide--dimethylbenzimidazole phosphoribosyltransferase [Oscillospiraceae bacterium]
MDLHKIITNITPPDESAREAARERWNACAKPLGSLGLLESAIEDIAALTGSAEVELDEKAVLVLCADNGVVRHGVTQTDSGVTAAVARNLALRRTSVCRMAEVAHCRVVPVDMGIVDFPGCDGVLNRRIGNGTADFTQGAAMTREQAERAILTGAELARCEAVRGTKLLALGEMGIGNTTTASAVASVLLGRSVQDVTGRGAGLSDEALERKIKTIRRGVSTNRPAAWDAVDVLTKVGGFDLAGLCGVCLGAAANRVPVLLDGFPSTVAALCAARMCPDAACAMLASHVSAEPAGAMVLKALGKRPLITAEMRLGEGTGAVAAMPLLDMALAVYRDAYTFTEGGIVPYTPQC